jgi:hypothetical protein
MEMDSRMCEIDVGQELNELMDRYEEEEGFLKRTEEIAFSNHMQAMKKYLEIYNRRTDVALKIRNLKDKVTGVLRQSIGEESEDEDN